MKIKIEFDLTPQEFRQSLGLPDIAGLQDEAVSLLKSRLGEDIGDIKMSSLVENWFTQGLAASRKVQELFTAAVTEVLDAETQTSATGTKGAKGTTKKNND
jgi:hypothetical protein